MEHEWEGVMIWRAFGWMDTLEDVTLRNGLTNTLGKIRLLESYQGPQGLTILCRKENRVEGKGIF